MKVVNILRRIGGFVVFAFLASAMHLLLPSPVHAAGEVFTWKSYNQIEVKGGDLKGTSTLTLANNTPPQNVTGVFLGELLYNKGDNNGCTVSIELYVFDSDGTGSGQVWNPPPYDSQSTGDGNGPGRCYLMGVTDLDPAIHEKRVNIGGTRPADPNDTTEDEEDKIARIGILAPDPQSKAPKTVTITIKQGNTVIATQTVPFTEDSAGTWPPDQTPVGASAIFTDLDPGVYIVCDNYVIPNCETFTKVKGEPFSENYGKQFETPDKKMIDGHIEYHTIRPCNASITVQPITVYLRLPDGKIITKQTNSKTINPGENEKEGDCNVDQIVGLDVLFENMAPGEYEACATAAPCVKFIKKAGEKAEFTLKVETTLQPPEDQKVCSSGSGIAGAFAVIVCPFTEAVAKGSEFFEKNIIIPFMTISPLTTNADNPIYILWQSFRNLANIGFIIFFFFIIFSQATSVGISQYGLKRMLSRVFLVVIGVNLSYFGAALVIDAFNIFGVGTSDLVTAAIKQATVTVNTGTGSTDLQSVFVLGGTALVAVILTGGAVLGWLFSLIMLAALIIAIVIMVLLLRQIAIITLVILAPIAILLYMLPNTENYFQKWRKTLIQLLLMYPMIVLLFASGKIFGMILQQPGIIQTGGGGMSDETAEAMRIIFQFLAYILPLALLPATFAASGTIMSKAYGMASRRFIQPRAQRAREGAGQLSSEARARLAKSGVPGVSWAAGGKYRRDYNRESRGRSVQEAQNEYMAGQMSAEGFMGNMRRRRAAGVGGEAGQTRTAAQAANVLEGARKQEMDNEMALLKAEMNRLGLSSAEFTKQFDKYVKGQIDEIVGPLRDASGQAQKLNMSKRGDLTRAALNQAARSGEIVSLENARLSANINQSMLDDVIKNNEGAVMGKGGWHLATNSNLAHGRSSGTAEAMNLARLQDTFAGSSSEDIAEMKGSFVNAVRGSLTNAGTRAQLLGPNGLSRAERDQIIRNIDGVLNNNNIRGEAKNVAALQEIKRQLR